MKMGLLAYHLLERAKLPDSEVHDLGMKITASASQLSESICVRENLVDSMLEGLEEQGLIKRMGGDRIILFGTNDGSLGSE